LVNIVKSRYTLGRTSSAWIFTTQNRLVFRWKSQVLDATQLLAEFVSAPNLTAAAAAQNLTWAPVSLPTVSVDNYTLTMITSDSALLTLTLSAELGVSRDITDVAPAAVTASGRRRLLQSSSSKCLSCC